MNEDFNAYKEITIPNAAETFSRHTYPTKVGDYTLITYLTTDNKRATAIYHETCGLSTIEKYKTTTEEYKSWNFWSKIITNSPPLILRDVYTNKIVFIGVKQ